MTRAEVGTDDDYGVGWACRVQHEDIVNVRGIRAVRGLVEGIHHLAGAGLHGHSFPGKPSVPPS